MTEDRTYRIDDLTAHAAYRVSPPGKDLRARAADSGWPDGLLDRVLAVRPNRDAVEEWIASGFPTAEMLEGWVRDQIRLMETSLTTRVATWADADMVVDLFANAPETVGEWTVTVERGPNPYAQYRLQEHSYLSLLEDHRIGLGVAAHSTRNTLIGGQRTSVHLMSGWRIRDGFRGKGLSRLLQNSAGPGSTWFGLVTYWYVRTGNEASSWISKVVDDMADRPNGFEQEAEQLTASVMQIDVDGADTSDRVRPLVDADVGRCIELINRTHDGLDLFLPYTDDFFDRRMSDSSWGPKPGFIPEVYGRPDYRVVEVDREVVACGGLWDRGRDMREVWCRSGRAESIVADPTALMDFGHAPGHGEAMAELIAHFAAESARLGRSGILAPLEFAPEAAEACARMVTGRETRELHVMPFSSPEVMIDAVVERPYIDLAYW